MDLAVTVVAITVGHRHPVTRPGGRVVGRAAVGRLENPDNRAVNRTVRPRGDRAVTVQTASRSTGIRLAHRRPRRPKRKVLILIHLFLNIPVRNAHACEIRGVPNYPPKPHQALTAIPPLPRKPAALPGEIPGAPALVHVT